MSAEYPISSLRDFLAIPPESIDACLADFKVWLEAARHPKEFSADMNELIGMPNAMSFSYDGFTWVDDGLGGIHHIDIVNADDNSPIGRISFEEKT
jgi:hypothetical protein